MRCNHPTQWQQVTEVPDQNGEAHYISVLGQVPFCPLPLPYLPSIYSLKEASSRCSKLPQTLGCGFSVDPLSYILTLTISLPLSLVVGC